MSVRVAFATTPLSSPEPPHDNTPSHPHMLPHARDVVARKGCTSVGMSPFYEICTGISMRKSFRNRVPAARVMFGKSTERSVGIYGSTAAELGIPAVEIAGDLDAMQTISPEKAEELADALRLAARVARGEIVATPLDDFLAKRRA